MTYLPMNMEPTEPETSVSAGENAAEPAASSGYTVSVPVAALTRRDDDPRYLTSDVNQVVVDFLEAGPPPLTAYESPTPGQFVVVVGAPFLEALAKAFTKVPVTVYRYAEHEVLAHMVTREATVALGRVARGYCVKNLVQLYANAPNPYAAAADATADVEGKPGVKAAQMRNYENLADIAEAHGEEEAATFPTTAAPQLRQIAKDRGVRVQDLPAQDLVAARRQQHANAFASELIGFASKPYAEMMEIFDIAWEKAEGEAADLISAWAVVTKCVKAGVSVLDIEDCLYELRAQVFRAQKTSQVDRRGQPQLPAGGAADDPARSTAGAPGSDGRDAAAAFNVEDADFTDTPNEGSEDAAGTAPAAEGAAAAASGATSVTVGGLEIDVRAVAGASEPALPSRPVKRSGQATGEAVAASQDGTHALAHVVTGAPAHADGEASGSTPPETQEAGPGVDADETAAQDGIETSRDRVKGALYMNVVDVRRFYELANKRLGTIQYLSADKRVPDEVQDDACQAVNDLASNLGLVPDGQRFLRRQRLYEHAAGREYLGTVEVAVMLAVCGSIEPLRRTPNGRQLVGQVCDVMRRQGLTLPSDATEAARVQGDGSETE